MQPRTEDGDLFELQQQEADAVLASTKPDALRRPYVSFEVPGGSGRGSGRGSGPGRGSASGSGSGDADVNYEADAESDSAAMRTRRVSHAHSHKSRSSMASTPNTFASEVLPGDEAAGSGSGSARLDSNEEDEAELEDEQQVDADVDELGAVEKPSGKPRKVLYQVASGKRSKPKERETQMPMPQTGGAAAPQPSAPADPAEREFTESDLQGEMRAVESRHHVSFNRLKSIMLATVRQRSRLNSTDALEYKLDSFERTSAMPLPL